MTQTQGPCIKGSPVSNIASLEPKAIGTYNDSVLASVDYTLSVLHKHGMKAIISPHDANVLNGSNGIDVYGYQYHNSDNFYKSSTAATQYDNRLKHILNYQSPAFGKPWSQLSEAIFAFDIQNEPLIGSGDLLNASMFHGDTTAGNWLCGRASTIAGLTQGSGVRVATGGIGGSDYCCNHEFNTLPAALQCSNVDIVSVHGYMSSSSQWAYFLPQRLVSMAQAAGKHLMVEEWGVTASPAGQFGSQVAVFNNQSGSAVPWMYWQVVPGCDATQSCSGACSDKSSQGYDGYEIGVNSTKGNVQAAIQRANGLTSAQDWSSFF